MTQEIIEKIKNFININDFLSAERLLKNLKNEHNPLILYYKGYVGYKLGKTKEAIECLEKIKTEIPEVSFLMANILEDLSKEINAIECLKKAVALQPTYWQAYFNLGRIYIKTRQFKK